MQTYSIPEGHYLDIAPIEGLPQRVHYHDMGEGEVVIFLHGAGGKMSPCWATHWAVPWHWAMHWPTQKM
jgi:hypothetical protein